MRASIGSTYVDETYWTARPEGEEWWPRFDDYIDIPDELVVRAKSADEAVVSALEECRAISAELDALLQSRTKV